VQKRHTIAGMKRYLVRTGDYLARIAFSLGVSSDKIWNAPENAALRELRGDGNVLATGDVLTIPEALRTCAHVDPGQNYEFRARVPRVPLRIAVRDVDGSAFVHMPYRVEGAGEPVQGVTDLEGIAEFSVPITAREVELVFEPGTHVMRLRLLIGHLDPLEHASGVRQRLTNLGYHAHEPGPSDTEISDQHTRAALAAFQREHRLKPTGEIDDETRRALGKAHQS
jgi:hypothetical protein